MAVKKEKWDKQCYSLQEAKENWGNVAGTIDYMKLGFKAKKPDWKKLDKLMKQTGKPAQYYMTMDGLVWTFEVLVGTTKLVMNRVDFGKTQSVQEQRESLRKLSLRTTVVTKDDLAKFDKEHADPEDTTAAVDLNKQIDDLRNENDLLRQMAGNYKAKAVDVALWSNKGFLEWAKKKGYSPFTDFLMDVDDDRGWSSKVVGFLKLGKKTGLKDSTLTELLIAHNADQKVDFTKARQEVARILNQAMLPKYNKEKLSELAKKIKDNEAEAKKLERQLKALKAA